MQCNFTLGHIHAMHCMLFLPPTVWTNFGAKRSFSHTRNMYKDLLHCESYAWKSAHKINRIEKEWKRAIRDVSSRLESYKNDKKTLVEDWSIPTGET